MIWDAAGELQSRHRGKPRGQPPSLRSSGRARGHGPGRLLTNKGARAFGVIVSAPNILTPQLASNDTGTADGKDHRRGNHSGGRSSGRWVQANSGANFAEDVNRLWEASGPETAAETRSRAPAESTGKTEPLPSRLAAARREEKPARRVSTPGTPGSRSRRGDSGR